ncbi:MAG: TIGR03885 family FMN-dependent LLM class oxidoreductase [Devosia sp.]|jgi:coenzyme F420-dependent glucose-6-phosphate dehydrogenase|uniref:TIGR03885 family FMN-dependent LLM class oxidoreductase n=1 Tax=Devosia sp. TaxID=1871048 RepID=UPI001A029EAA|nr:TIGR03885 family FMN-dependent LLM class oxidoreductase [Devosia sp.]MBF0678970.1 TIGR03885 family FMN-dependent LLM class oxidoreductase [Devosia sp.]
MTSIGYHASHEQFSPRTLVELVKKAEAAGFSCAKSSDHFQPWSERQGHSGFAWSWLGAALEATAFPIGSITAPGYRYHPAIIAQAAATLGEMFPSRFWLALGTGEAINESITGLPWPEKAERNALLRECVDIIRALFDGETVTHRGRVTVIEAKLYSLPDHPVPLFGAAMTPRTAAWCGGWADGLLTVGGDLDTVRRVVDAFRENGGEHKPIHIQQALSWADTEAEALEMALEQWGPAAIGGEAAWDLRRPSDFDTVARLVGEAEIRKSVAISADPGRHRAWIEALATLDPQAIHLHCVGTNQSAFIDMAARHLVPIAAG